MDVGQFDIPRLDDKKGISPLWAQPDWKTDKGLLKWFYNTLPILEEVHEPFIRRCYNNLLWYTGEYDGNSEYRLVAPGRPQVSIPQYMVPVVINHLYDLTEQRTSRLAVYKPNFDTAPHNNEESDRISARHMKVMIEAVRRANRFDYVLSELDKWCTIFGCVYAAIFWDPNKGPKDKKDKHIGDVVVNIKEPYWVLPEPKRDWEKVNFIVEIHDVMHIEEVRKRWNVPRLKADELTTIWSFSNSDTQEKQADEVVVYRLLYKPNEFLEEGLEVLIAGNIVLERNLEWKYSHNDFPYERYTDIDVPGRIHPLSTYNYLIPIQHQYNKMTSLIHRNITVAAHPKWIMTKGACDIKQLGNTAGIVQVNPGAGEPKLVAYNTVPQEVFQYRESMRQEMGQLAATQGVSRGDPPPNARAASMLQFYEQQEMQRNGVIIDKRNELVRRIYRKVGSTIQDYYPENPDRMIRAIGRDNRFDIIRFDEVEMSGDYDVIIQNSTGFSESKAGRIEEITFLMEKVPGLLSPTQVADILEINSPQKFYDIATAALHQAERENQDFLDGRPVMSPMIQDDHLTHRDTHIVFMQSETFKRLPKRFREAIQEHVMVHEGLMYEIAKKSPQMAKILTTLPNFPLFKTPEMLPMPTAEETVQPAGKPGRPKTPPTPQEEGQALAGPALNPLEPPALQ